MPVKGTYLAIAGGGIVLLWSGLAGKKWSDVLRQVIAGKDPKAVTSAYVINSPMGSAQSGILSGEVSTRNLPKGGNEAANRAAGMIIAARYGWTGADWKALDYGWGTLESGWNSLATNPSSGAFGIAQALGHGTASTRGSITNEYGNYGTSDAICRAANSGNGPAQIVWGCNYIRQTYGRPSHIPGWTGGGGYSGY